MKRLHLLLISCLLLFCLLGRPNAQSTFTLEQVLTRVNLARQDIQSGEVLVTASGYNAPSRTLVEAQEWLEGQKAELRKEIEDGAKAGAPHLADEAGRERYYKHRSEMFAEMFQNLFEKYICKVRTAHQPLKAPAGIKRTDSECDRDLEGV